MTMLSLKLTVSSGVVIVLFFCIMSIIRQAHADDIDDGNTTFSGSHFLLYGVNFGEGFNLRRDVYMRIANLIRFLNADCSKSRKCNWTLVLPPWGRLYHWFNDRDLERVPWSQFFDIMSLQRFVPVIEFDEFLTKVPNRSVDIVIYLQRYPDGEALSNTVPWSEKADIRPCSENHGYMRDNENMWRGWMFGYGNDIQIKNFTCLSVQMEVRSFATFLQDRVEGRVLMLDRGEQIIHGTHSEWSPEWWTARRSMVFSKRLQSIADKFRSDYLNSTDLSDKTRKVGDWRKNVRTGGDAVGGPYVAIHLRRKDFTYAHPSATPPIEVAADHIRQFAKEASVKKVFIASDEPDLTQLAGLLPDFSVYRFSSKNLSDGDLAIVDQIICAHAKVFVGTSPSTFTSRIIEERTILGFHEQSSTNTICNSKDLSKCEKATFWPAKFEPEFSIVPKDDDVKEKDEL